MAPPTRAERLLLDLGCRIGELESALQTVTVYVLEGNEEVEELRDELRRAGVIPRPPRRRKAKPA
jgi:hypothetical protein